MQGMIHGEAEKGFNKSTSDVILFFLTGVLEIESKLAQLLKDVC